MDYLWNVFTPTVLNKTKIKTYKKSILTQKINAVREAANFEYNIFNNLPDGIIILNKHKQILAMNEYACRYFNLSKNDLNIELLPSPFKKLINSITENSNSKIEAYNELYDDKSDRYFNVRASEIKSGDKKNILLIFSDITLQTKLYRKKLINEKLNTLSRLAANLAHEIRNPLTAIYGLLQLMHLKSNSKNIKPYTEWILEEVEQINIVISELLTLTKLNSPYIVLSDLKDMFSEIKPYILKYSKPAQVKIIWDIAEKLPLIKVDTVQMKFAFLNLVKNAIEAMPNGSTLFIKAYYNDIVNKVVISFMNNGIGTTGEISNNIINKNRPEFEICKVIVENHGGEIKIKTKQQEGSSFSIILPTAGE
ncbi:MAG: two-component system, sporulation sensor kinase [Thermosediminibacterales bacterium]|nr:two-component system, sporulation sensor kinase [Thermosediminibacterales bacterium]MDK2836739.1 two-component system, sporulation sensor kinase [Thermosediminibacterales bacterium]